MQEAGDFFDVRKKRWPDPKNRFFRKAIDAVKRMGVAN